MPRSRPPRSRPASTSTARSPWRVATRRRARSSSWPTRRDCGSRARRSPSWATPSRPPGACSTPARSGPCASSTRRSTGAGSRPGIRDLRRSTPSGRWRTSASTPSRTSPPSSARRAASPLTAEVVYPDRVTTSGEPFTVGAPDFGVALIELADGTLVRLTTSFYVGQHSKQRGIEFHGDDGLLVHLELAGLRRRGRARAVRGAYEPVPVPDAFRGIDWGRALDELSDGDHRTAPAPRHRRARRPRGRDPRCRGDVDDARAGPSRSPRPSARRPRPDERTHLVTANGIAGVRR